MRRSTWKLTSIVPPLTSGDASASIATSASGSRFPCTITLGKDGEFGAVRSVANEILVGKTELSYTYTQPVRDGQRYNMYHGTLEARPVTATTSKIVYTLFFDNSNLPDDAAKQADKDRRRTQFMRALQNMKTLAEGGTLPPPPARGGR